MRLEGDWAKLRDPQQLEAWLDEVTESDWNVFIEGPPHGKSRPVQVLKYLARYLTGGPISDGRIIRDENDRVFFWARSKNKSAGNPSREFDLRGKEFVRRWSMHILPKGYTRSRCFGGYHSSKRGDYLLRCRELLSTVSLPAPPASDRSEPSPPTCPRCELVMCCILKQPRPSWKEVFERRIYASPSIYSPMHHYDTRGSPAFGYGPDG